MISRVRVVAAIIVLTFLVGIVWELGWDSFVGSRRLLPSSEVVLRPGMAVTVRTALGPVTVAAGRGTERTYSSRAWSRRLRLTARRERWGGSLGLYDGHVYGGGSALVVEEGQIHVPTRLDALRWLTFLADNDSVVYTRDGLVLAVAPSRQAGYPAPGIIQLWQLYVDGRRPHDLPLSNDAAFALSGGAIPDSAVKHDAAVGYTLELSGPRAAASHFGDTTLVSPAPPPR